MEDWLIIEKFHERSEEAIGDLSEKYGSMCHRIAKGILDSEQDAEECVNDALLAAWNSIPPEKPDPLSAYIGRITRNLSLKKYHANTAQKRNGRYDAVLDELQDCLAGTVTVEDEILAKELARAINDFLAGIKKTDRIIFVKRYWFLAPIPEIAEELGKSRNYVTVRLHRTRKKLEHCLKEEELIA